MITIQKGVPINKTIYITNHDETVYNITGKTIFFTVKNLSDTADNDTSALITKTITVHTNAALGVSILSLSAVQTNIATGNYKADFKIYDGSTNINTYTENVKVIRVVTERIT
jgi:hypothetical protein